MTGDHAEHQEKLERGGGGGGGFHCKYDGFIVNMMIISKVDTQLNVPSESNHAYYQQTENSSRYLCQLNKLDMLIIVLKTSTAGDL